MRSIAMVFIVLSIGACASPSSPGGDGTCRIDGEACGATTDCCNPLLCVAGTCQRHPDGGASQCGDTNQACCANNACRNGLVCTGNKCVPASCMGAAEQACGKCGTQTRTCNNGTWSSWSACAGEGECSAGSMADCGGGQMKTCDVTCH